MRLLGAVLHRDPDLPSPRILTMPGEQRLAIAVNLLSAQRDRIYLHSVTADRCAQRAARHRHLGVHVRPELDDWRAAELGCPRSELLLPPRRIGIEPQHRE